MVYRNAAHLHVKLNEKEFDVLNDSFLCLYIFYAYLRF